MLFVLHDRYTLSVLTQYSLLASTFADNSLWFSVQIRYCLNYVVILKHFYFFSLLVGDPQIRRKMTKEIKSPKAKIGLLNKFQRVWFTRKTYLTRKTKSLIFSNRVVLDHCSTCTLLPPYKQLDFFSLISKKCVRYMCRNHTLGNNSKIS